MATSGCARPWQTRSRWAVPMLPRCAAFNRSRRPDACAGSPHRAGHPVTLRTATAGNDRLRRLARSGGDAVNAASVALEAATIRQQCKVLRMPTIAAQCAQLAEQAVRERRTHLGYLEALLQAELEDREHRLVERRLREAHLPRVK